MDYQRRALTAADLSLDPSTGAVAVATHGRRRLGAPTRWGTGGAARLTMTLAGLTNNAARMGQSADFGAVFCEWVEFWLTTRFALAPTADKALELWWAASPDGVGWPGGVSGADGAFTAANKSQLLLVGVLTTLASATSQSQLVGSIRLPSRWGAPVLLNASGQTLSATAADHLLEAYPVQ